MKMNRSSMSDNVVKLQELFILRKFDEALELCYKCLETISSFSVPNTKDASQKSSPIKRDVVIHNLHRLRHDCATQNCRCTQFVAVLVQSLFMLEQGPQVTKFLCNFYGPLNKIPFKILFLRFLFFFFSLCFLFFSSSLFLLFSSGLNETLLQYKWTHFGERLQWSREHSALLFGK